MNLVKRAANSLTSNHIWRPARSSPTSFPTHGALAPCFNGYPNASCTSRPQPEAVQMTCRSQVNRAVDQRRRRVNILIEAGSVQHSPLARGTDDGKLPTL